MCHKGQPDCMPHALGKQYFSTFGFSVFSKICLYPFYLFLPACQAKPHALPSPSLLWAAGFSLSRALCIRKISPDGAVPCMSEWRRHHSSLMDSEAPFLQVGLELWVPAALLPKLETGIPRFSAQTTREGWRTAPGATGGTGVGQFHVGLFLTG